MVSITYGSHTICYPAVLALERSIRKVYLFEVSNLPFWEDLLVSRHKRRSLDGNPTSECHLCILGPLVMINAATTCSEGMLFVNEVTVSRTDCFCFC